MFVIREDQEVVITTLTVVQDTLNVEQKYSILCFQAEFKPENSA